jgi:hypothetical protein
VALIANEPAGYVAAHRQRTVKEHGDERDENARFKRQEARDGGRDDGNDGRR